MSPLRFPGRYRCAASLAGVTDVTLLVNRKEVQLDPTLRDLMLRRVGDPERDFADLKARSPVYRAADFDVPVFLAHGTRDPVVDVEHAHRLRRMLDLYGKPYEWQLLEGAGHGFADVRQAVEWCAHLEKFLEKYLGEAAPRAAASPTLPAAESR
jgi:dipeptidyl aminopeptidase/acylaminoacyl peptidase